MTSPAGPPNPQSNDTAPITAGGSNGSQLHDAFGRPLSDLRISVTDRCNFRCSYCMPKEVYGAGFRFLPKPDILSFEEITRVAGVFVRAGVRKLRLTGGEPLLRSQLPKLVNSLAALGADLALTTNGSLLAKYAQALVDAGLSRVTVSLDALDDATFRRMNDMSFPVNAVLDGIAAARAVGLPVKVNTVVQKGVNDGEVLPLAEHFRNSGIPLRFIEFMDVGSTNGWRPETVTSGREILERIGTRYPLHPVDPNQRGEVAERWRYADGAGEIGVITSVTQPFCRDCTRARLSAEGKLYTCLFASHGHDLRDLLRDGTDDADLTKRIADIWSARRDRYSELREAGQARHDKIEMSYIGG